MRAIVLSITLIILSGCASSTLEIKSQNLPYENTKYEKKSTPTADTPAKFQSDISSRKLDAQRQLETYIKMQNCLLQFMDSR